MFWNQYPYINLNDLNLDFLLKAIGEMKNEVTNFVSINAIKYADPIQWDITRQYEKNTIVIDPVTGTAYISVAPVPAGVALTRPEFWTVVFDLQSFVTKANQNLANNYEEQTTTTATMNTTAGAWVIWGDVLYKALVNITAGDAYVVGSNIERITIEDVIKAIVQDITDEVQARQDADTAMQGAIDDEVRARIDAINDVLSKLGNLENLDTEIKTSAVAAINELHSDIENMTQYDKADIRNYGGVGDGVTNDTQAFNACLAENNMVYLPYFAGCNGYVLDEVTLTSHQSVIGDNRTVIRQNATKLFTITGNYVTIKSLFIICSTTVNQTVFNMKFTGDSGLAFHFVIEDISIDNPYTIYTDAESTQQYICTYMQNIIGYKTRGVGYYVHHAFAFMFMRSCTTDRNLLQADYLGFDFNNVEGLHLDYCEVSAGYLTGDSQTGTGFSFVNCRAVWAFNCFSDYISGIGYDYNGCSYIHINGCGASLTTLGGYRFYNCHFVEMVECYIAGQDNTSPYNSGLWIGGGSDKFTVGNCVIDKYTYDGIYINNSTGVIVSACSITNTTQNSVEIDTCTDCLVIGCRGDDTMINNSSANNSHILDCISSDGFTDDRPTTP